MPICSALRIGRKNLVEFVVKQEVIEQEDVKNTISRVVLYVIRLLLADFIISTCDATQLPDGDKDGKKAHQ